MKILIRADAYPDIALGHLGRCIRLGQSLRAKSHDINFLVYDDCTAIKRLEDANFDYHLIPYKINDASTFEQELEVLSARSALIDVFIVDSYSVDEHYFDRIKGLFKNVVYLDDLGSDFNVDMVINPSCKVQENHYISRSVLCGMDYVILGSEYTMGKQVTNDNKCDSILVTMGGIDHYDLSSRVIPMLESIAPNIIVNMVIGPYYENVDKIKYTAHRSKLEINFFEGLSNISSVILQSDVAISAGGFTVYELAAMSTPCVGIALWKNQNENIECLSNKETLMPLYYTDDISFDEELKNSIATILENSSLRANMAMAARNAVDGRGSDRISKVITRNYA